MCFILRAVHRQDREKLGMQENICVVVRISKLQNMPKNIFSNLLEISLYRRGVESILNAYLGK